MFTFSLLLGTFLSAGSLQEPAKAPERTVAQLRARLTAYERQVETGKPDPAELAAIARDVLQRAQESPDPDAVIQACVSPFVSDEAACAPKLWSIAKGTAGTLAQRASAAAALARRKDASAAEYLFGLLKPLAPAQLARLAMTLDALPPERALALLEPMLKTEAISPQSAACHVLARIDAAESRRALASHLESAPRGTESWFACTVAAAELGDPMARETVRHMHTHMSNENLVSAGALLVDIDPELGVSLLMQATRESTDEWARLEAADRLVTLRPDVAVSMMERALTRGVPALTAAALELHRALALEPSRQTRAFLVDAHPLVQLRAAETILAWDTRRRAAAKPALRPI